MSLSGIWFCIVTNRQRVNSVSASASFEIETVHLLSNTRFLQLSLRKIIGR
jgi:hypothetical protein